MTTVNTDARDGVISALAAYLVWGFLPAYFVFVKAVDPTEVLAHRVIWAIPFGALILTFRAQWQEVGRALTHSGMRKWLALSALFIGLNWFVYIWAVQDERILETSLGYYINPLTNMLAGYCLFGERLRRHQKLAVVLATIGVLVLALSGDGVPWVALVLALTFTVYAVVRKRVVIGGMPGLFVETVFLLPFALAWSGWLLHTSTLAFADSGVSMKIWLAMAGPITAIPLLCFALAARRLSLTTIGFMQFLAPTIQFGAGIYFGETLSVAHIVCFTCIWTAVGFFIYDAVSTARKRPPPLVAKGA